MEILKLRQLLPDLLPLALPLASHSPVRRVYSTSHDFQGVFSGLSGFPFQAFAHLYVFIQSSSLIEVVSKEERLLGREVVELVEVAVAGVRVRFPVSHPEHLQVPALVLDFVFLSGLNIRRVVVTFTQILRLHLHIEMAIGSVLLFQLTILGLALVFSASALLDIVGNHGGDVRERELRAHASLGLDFLFHLFLTKVCLDFQNLLFDLIRNTISMFLFLLAGLFLSQLSLALGSLLAHDHLASLEEKLVLGRAFAGLGDGAQCIRACPRSASLPTAMLRPQPTGLALELRLVYPNRSTALVVEVLLGAKGSLGQGGVVVPGLDQRSLIGLSFQSLLLVQR